MKDLDQGISPVESSKTEEIIGEDTAVSPENPTSTVSAEETQIPLPEQIRTELSVVKSEATRQEDIINNTVAEVVTLRTELGIAPDEEIPSIVPNKQKIEELTERRLELEARLEQVLRSDLSHKYEDVIKEVKDSKIDWAESEELGRRLKLKGATDEDVEQVREWLVSNATNAKTFVLPPRIFAEAVDVLGQMTGESTLDNGDAFHVPGGRTDVPDHIKSSIFVKEKPGVPGKEAPRNSIDTATLHHEYGHVTQDGLLQSALYTDYAPKIKDGAPDPEYVGSITETDTRIRSMFRELSGLFDPKKEAFGSKELELLKEKGKKGKLGRDTQDLLNHYDDETLIELANTQPAI